LARQEDVFEGKEVVVVVEIQWLESMQRNTIRIMCHVALFPLSALFLLELVVSWAWICHRVESQSDKLKPTCGHFKEPKLTTGDAGFSIKTMFIAADFHRQEVVAVALSTRVCLVPVKW
jgi:hypothetical protein